MGNPTLLIFIAVAEKELKLPIKNWTEDLGNFLQKAYDSRPESGLYIVGGGKGNQFYDILDIRDRCNLEGLDFLSSECATLQGLELVSAIHSLTIIIDVMSDALANNKIFVFINYIF